MSPITRLQDGIHDWFRTWPQRQPWKDIPVLLALLLGLAFVFVVMFWDPMSVRARYVGYANNALAKNDFPTVLVASERLLGIDSAWRNQALFGVALAQQGLGDEAKAADTMRQVAPPNRPVFATAHMYLAKTMLQRVGAAPELLPLIKAHLNQVLALEPESVEANEMLGSLYASQKQWEFAYKYYTAIIKEKPESMLLLARIAKERGNANAAETWTRDAQIHFQHAVENPGSDNPKNRISYIESLMMSNEFEKAKAVLDVGRKLSGNDPYKTVAPAVFAGLARKLAENGTGDLDFRAKMIREGMEADPKDPALLALLLELSEENGAESQTAGDSIIKIMERKHIWPPLLFVGAKVASKRQNTFGMRVYLHKAFQDFPLALPMACNLSTTICDTGEAENLPFALEMMDFALERFHEQPFLRLSRGLILICSSRPQDALPDLQFALDHLEDKAPAHRALARAYFTLGMENLAREHQRLSTLPAKAEASPTTKPANDGR
jgi:tetratricopeptide (TPR) repeat protein